MASLYKKHGRSGTLWSIDFYDSQQVRKRIRLGRLNRRQAELIKTRIELLIAARIAGTAPDDETSRWVANCDDKLHAKLKKHGLVARRKTVDSVTLADFLDGYIVGRTDIKPNTREHLQRARRNLVDFFGANKPLSEITPGAADDFRQHLQKTMADNTVRRICGRAKQFFRAALRHKLIPESPFADMKGTGVRANKSRDYFVTRNEATKVLNACPSVEWQLIFALSRFCGLRCPTEHLAMLWGDVDWERDRLLVRSSKTEHHDGKDTRIIPIFPEIRPYLEAAWDEAPVGSVYVIAGHRDPNANLRTELERIIAKAGLKPWPKLFQNLRSTRETELAEDWPIHVVCEWIGNSEAVARKHYLQVTDEHYKKAAQKAAQTASDNSRIDGQDSATQSETSKMSGEDTSCPPLSLDLAPPVGLEPATQRLTV